MTDGERLALTRVWWTWDKPEVCKAIASAVHKRWLAIARTPLQESAPMKQREGTEENPGRKLLPGLLALLQVSQYSAGHLAGMEKQRNTPSMSFLLGLATAMKMNVRDFYPATTQEWVADTAHYFCTRNDLPGQESVSSSEVRAYAAFMLDDLPEPKAYTEEEIEWRLMRLSADWRIMVQKVARKLGPILLPYDPLA